MNTKSFKFVWPVLFFGLTVYAWMQLGRVAASDVGTSVGNEVGRLFGGSQVPNHPVLGWALLGVAGASFTCGIYSLWQLFKGLRHERRG